MQNKGILMVISGFSGAGKGTLVKKLLSEYDNYALSISMTTRQPREGEEDGREYFFRTREQFEENIAKNGFIEYAQYCGNYYGTPKDYVDQLLNEGKNVVLEIEVQGALQVMEKCPDATTIFLVPPSLEELERRIRGRRTEEEEIVQQRLSKARKEIATKDEYKYVVENDDVMAAKDKIAEIIKNHQTNQG